MKTFEEYLQYIHQDIFFDVLDDELPDSFDNWISTMDTDELIKYADEFKNLAEQSLVQRVKDIIEKERQTWAKESIGEVAVKSVAKAIDELPITPKGK